MWNPQIAPRSTHWLLWLAVNWCCSSVLLTVFYKSLRFVPGSLPDTPTHSRNAHWSIVLRLWFSVSLIIRAAPYTDSGLLVMWYHWVHVCYTTKTIIKPSVTKSEFILWAKSINLYTLFFFLQNRPYKDNTCVHYRKSYGYAHHLTIDGWARQTAAWATV